MPRSANGLKVCSTCQVSRPVTDFWKSKDRPDGLQYSCIPCCKDRAQRNAVGLHQAQSDWHERHKDKRHAYERERRIQRLYGWTLNEYERRLSEGCALCGSMDNLHVDHDHSCCGRSKACAKCIRGILCANHNRGLGHFQDDPDLLRRAAAYLERIQCT